MDKKQGFQISSVKDFLYYLVYIIGALIVYTPIALILLGAFVGLVTVTSVQNDSNSLTTLFLGLIGFVLVLAGLCFTYKPDNTKHRHELEKKGRAFTLQAVVLFASFFALAGLNFLKNIPEKQNLFPQVISFLGLAGILIMFAWLPFTLFDFVLELFRVREKTKWLTDKYMEIQDSQYGFWFQLIVMLLFIITGLFLRSLK